MTSALYVQFSWVIRFQTFKETDDRIIKFVFFATGLSKFFKTIYEIVLLNLLTGSNS